ncbi:NAD(P)-dependent oxidoreductase [Rothia aerolata]|uniref:2-hydroxy-3-oxopropionate reductase n=1 Tax=Rothia aerolata TaxID=1812262 RepID=A0A917IWK7_9MICC|nr:NAD(P)-dependent oxidoreductase [Rothia aerolata]GGH65993.1 2-hydroxy-3-oxopropionate reductase [Rothia aerolata]
MAPSPRIGIIGTGAMGKPMAQHIATANPNLVCYTTHDGLPLSTLKAASHVPTNFDVGAGSDVVLTVLPDLPQLREVLYGDSTGEDRGLLAGIGNRDVLLIISSSSSPDGVRKLAEELTASTSVRVVDAPLSGGVEGAAAGTLSIMVGGSQADATQAISVLSACGTPVHLGPLGAGQVAKACNQLIVAATVMAVGEAAVLAQRSDLDLRQMFELLGGGYAGSKVLTTKAFRMADEDYDGGGAAKYMVKDLGIARSIAESTETNSVLGGPLFSAFEELSESAGLGDKDICVTRKFIEER